MHEVTSAASGAAEDKGIIRGNVKYPWGTVGGATVRVGERSGTTDKAGGYEILALPAGVYDVTVEAPISGYKAPAQKVDVAAGETKTVEIYLDFLKSLVEGHVYDQDGKPLRGATLSGVLSGKEMGTATTDEQGYFRFDSATPGDRHIRVTAPGYLGEVKDFTAKEDEVTNLEFRLTRATGKVYGNVTDEGGQPLQAEMTLKKGAVIVERTLSDAETGYYELTVLPGTWVINASVARRESEARQVSISADTRVDFSLPPVPPPGPIGTETPSGCLSALRMRQ